MKDFKEFLTEARRTDTIDKVQKMFDDGFKGTSFVTDVGESGPHSFELKKGDKDCGEVSIMRVSGKTSTYILLNGLSKSDSNKVIKIAKKIFGELGLSPTEKEEGSWGIKQYFSK